MISWRSCCYYYIAAKVVWPDTEEQAEIDIHRRQSHTIHMYTYIATPGLGHVRTFRESCGSMRRRSLGIQNPPMRFFATFLRAFTSGLPPNGPLSAWVLGPRSCND